METKHKTFQLSDVHFAFGLVQFKEATGWFGIRDKPRMMLYTNRFWEKRQVQWCVEVVEADEDEDGPNTNGWTVVNMWEHKPKVTIVATQAAKSLINRVYDSLRSLLK